MTTHNNSPLPGIQTLRNALFLIKEKALIISDLHIGLESSLHAKGLLIPKTQRKEFLEEFRHIFQEVIPDTIIINGDLKHEFGRISDQEWEDILYLIDFLKKKTQLIIIEGNHDPLLDKVLAKRGIPIQKSWTSGHFFVCHGDSLLPIPTAKTKSGRQGPNKVQTIIIGHIHPATTLTDGIRTEKYKCFLIGKWKEKNLIVLPSFNPLITGNEDYTFSPFVKGKMKRYILDESGEGHTF